MSGIGVFICDCKGQVSDRVDTERLAEAAGKLENVAFVERKGLDDLLCCPLGRWMCRHVEVGDLTAVMAKHNEREQNSKRCGRDGEEVNGDDVLDVIVEERTPSL